MEIYRKLTVGLVMTLLSFGIEASEWVQKYQKEGIEVFTREVKGSEFLEFRGETTVDQPLSSIVSMIWTVEDMPKWMFGVKKAELLSSTGVFDRQLYFVNAAPFPLKDRDLAVVNSARQDPETLATHCTMTLVDSPLKSEYVRVAKMDGFIDLIPQGVGKTKIVYQAHIEAGGQVPAWTANMYALDNPLNTLKGMRKLMTEKSYPAHASIRDYK